MKQKIKDSIYLAGQATGLPNTEAEAYFQKYEDYYKKKGYRVINPMKATLAIGNTHMLLTDEMPDEPLIMRRLLHLLSGCENIAMLPSWTNSTGAQIERLWAIRHNINIIYANEL